MSPRPRAAHLGPEKRRPLVLDAALELFVEHGFGGVSMEMIAEGAGVTRPVVYDCYPNKTELFRALIEREEQRLLDHLLEALPRQPDFEHPEKLLTEGFTAFLSAAQSAPDSWRLVFLSKHGSDPEVAQRVERAREQVTDRITQLSVFTLSQAGAPDAQRMAPLVAHLLVGQAEASVRFMLTQPGDWTPDQLGPFLGRANAAVLKLLARDQRA
jgi:AcrR family transcriptional regulator